MVEIARLAPSRHQPRRQFSEEDLRSLADSIRSSGVLQPILARRVGEKLEIVAGERRWRAAQMAGLATVPVLIREVSDQESAVFGLIENIQREDLNAIDKGLALQRLLDQLGCTQEDLAKRVGMDRSTLANFVRLLDLPQEVQEHVSRGTLSMGHARALLGLPESERTRIADLAIRQGLSVRQLEEKVRGTGGARSSSKPASGKGRGRPVWLNELEETLTEALGTRVVVRYGNKRSRIVIECIGREEFERVYARLKDL
ncbi:MAG: ParB/RepB/Spo0J family partition protein [Planctomycetota bacterium]